MNNTPVPMNIDRNRAPTRGQETLRMPASNVEKKDTMPETAQNTTKATNIIKWPI